MLAVMVAGCTSAGTASSSPSVGPASIAIPIQSPWRASPPVCPEALLHGTLVADAKWGIAIRSEAAGGVIKVVWPHGYSANPGPPIEVLDDAGRLVACEGDSVALPGGQEMDGRWQVCPGLAPLPASS